MVLVLSAVAAIGARAQIFTYQLSGTLNAESGPVFGMETETPFTGTFTVDLSLNTSSTTVLTGGILFDHVAENDFYGFSVSTIVSLSFTTGTRTWTKADLASAAESLGVDFWASSNLTTTPQYVKFSFFGGEGSEGEHGFSLGSVSGGDGTIRMDGWSVLDDGDTDNSASGYYTSITAVSAVPEPSTYAAIVGALALMGGAAWRRRNGGRRTED